MPRVMPRSLRLLLWLGALPLANASAQYTDLRSVAGRALATRVELQAMVDSLDVAAAKANPRQRGRLQAIVIDERRRLQDGDFQPGDRILVRVSTESVRADTITVSSQYSAQIPGVPDIPLRGILRSELEQYMQDQLDRYVRNARVSATPLVSIGVLGSVMRPGFYWISATSSISEAVMVAGGPMTDADPQGMSVQHGGKDLWSRTEMVAAIQTQMSLGSLGVRAGDHLLVRKLAPPVDRNFVIGVVAILLQGVVTISALLATGG